MSHKQPSGLPATDLQPGESVLVPPMERLAQTINRILERIVAKKKKNWWADVGEELLQLRAAAWALQRLVVFCAPPGSQMPHKALKAGAVELYKRGLFSPIEAKNLFHKASGKSRGEQPKYRFVTATVLEAKEKAKRNGHPLTWLKLARMFCPCGKVMHYGDCADRLYRNVKHLNKLLQQITLFCDTFDRLPTYNHPN